MGEKVRRWDSILKKQAIVSKRKGTWIKGSLEPSPKTKSQGIWKKIPNNHSRGLEIKEIIR